MRLILALVFAAIPLLAPAEDEHVHAALLSEQDAFVPGTTAWLGLRLTHSPHWHTYWINPGDSGLPTKLAWQLPAGFHAGEIAWPTPQRIDVGGLQNFGYEGDVLLPVPIDVPATATPGSTAHLAVTVKWLVCHDECIPGKADLALDLPVRADAGKSTSTALFDAARTALPTPAKWTGAAHLHGDEIEVTVRNSNLSSVSDVFVVPRKITNYTPPQITHDGDHWTLTFAKSDYFVSAPPQIDLVVRSGKQAQSVSVPFSSATP